MCNALFAIINVHLNKFLTVQKQTTEIPFPLIYFEISPPPPSSAQLKTEEVSESCS